MIGCPKCNYTGWKFKEVNGYFTAFPCECREREIEYRKHPQKLWDFDVHKNDPEYHKDLRGGNNG